MKGYQAELLDLAREIAASEGLSLAAALEVAQIELAAIVAYAQAWDCIVAEQSPARPIAHRVSAA